MLGRKTRNRQGRERERGSREMKMQTNGYTEKKSIKKVKGRGHAVTPSRHEIQRDESKTGTGDRQGHLDRKGGSGRQISVGDEQGLTHRCRGSRQTHTRDREHRHWRRGGRQKWTNMLF